MSCDSDTQVGSAQSDSTRIVKVNCHKKNRRKMRPYSITTNLRFTAEVNATNITHIYTHYRQQGAITA